MPAETLGKSTPVDKDSPIENIIVLVQENHSFDDYFGHFGKYAKRKYNLFVLAMNKREYQSINHSV